MAPSNQPPEKYAATLDSIQEAQQRISHESHVTPVLTSTSLDVKVQGRRLFFKCEMFQKGGSFKFRGAFNAVQSLSEEAAQRGVVTHSSGNHAAALALAARVRGIPAHIVVPRTAPAVKVEAVRRYGARVVLCEPTMAAREAAAAQVVAETGAELIPPYNDGRVMSGQGTVALELLEQVPYLDAIVVPVSGGGLASGIAIAAKALKPSIRVLLAEPSGADDVARSKAVGELIPCTEPRTIADGLRASLGSLTWPVVRDLVDGVICVSDSEIIDAMRLLYSHLKVVVEPSGASALAAVLSEQLSGNEAWSTSLKNVGVVLSGGNLDLEPLWEAIGSQAKGIAA